MLYTKYSLGLSTITQVPSSKTVVEPEVAVVEGSIATGTRVS